LNRLTDISKIPIAEYQLFGKSILSVLANCLKFLRIQKMIG
jgi:hypothetical protein